VPTPVVGAERGGASPGGEPAAHLEDAGGRGAGRHQQQQRERGVEEEGERGARGHRLLVAGRANGEFETDLRLRAANNYCRRQLRQGE